MARRLALVVLCLLFGVGVEHAFQAPAGPPPQGRATFRAGVDLIQLDVVVTDKNNQPITDLTAADFTVTEASRPQTVETFQHVSIPVEHRTIDVTQKPGPSPDVATNAPASPNSRLWAMIIDDQHIIEHDIIHVKQVIADFLRALPTDDQVAIVFVSRSDLSVNFTSDLGRLLRSIDNVRGAFGFGLDALGKDSSRRMLPHEGLAHATTAVYALNNATQALAGSGHVRRAIVYVSGFSIIPPFAPGCLDCAVLEANLQDAYDLARRADVPIYTLDPRGIPRPPTAVRSLTLAYDPGIIKNIEIQEDHLIEIAERTGGRALVHQEDLTKAVDEIVGDNGSFYMLGYSPSPVVHDGKFHPVKVTVNRPGAIVRARAGYVAAGATNIVQTPEQMLDQAMGRGVDVAGLTLRAFAAPVAATAKGMTTAVVVDVTYPPSGSLPARLDDNLRVNVIALDADAAVKGNIGQEWHVAAMPTEDHSVGVRLDELIDLPPGTLTLRIGVVSPTVGRAGTIQLPIVVPNPSSGKLQIGGIAVGVVGSSAPAAAGYDRLSAIVPFQPITTRTFTLADTVRVFAPLFWTTKDPSVEVSVALSGVRPGTPQHVTLPATSTTDGHSHAALDLTLPLKELAPGPCAITVTARLAGGAQISRVVPCAVEPPR